jgi:hypothetical protein
MRRRHTEKQAVIFSWTFQESQIERRENQNDSDVHDQPLPKLISEKKDIHADDDGDQQHDGDCDDM